MPESFLGSKLHGLISGGIIGDLFANEIWGAYHSGKFICGVGGGDYYRNFTLRY